MTPNVCERAYNMRKEGMRCTDIANALGYRHAAAVTKLIERHEKANGLKDSIRRRFRAERLEGDQLLTFQRNIRLLMRVNFVAFTDIWGCRANPHWAFEMCFVRDLQKFADFFLEELDDLTDEDLRKWPVETLLKEHLRSHWGPKLEGDDR